MCRPRELIFVCTFNYFYYYRKNQDQYVFTIEELKNKNVNTFLLLLQYYALSSCIIYCVNMDGTFNIR